MQLSTVVFRRFDISQVKHHWSSLISNLVWCILTLYLDAHRSDWDWQACIDFHWITNFILFLTKKVSEMLEHTALIILSNTFVLFFESPHSHSLPSFKKEQPGYSIKCICFQQHLWVRLYLSSDLHWNGSVIENILVLYSIVFLIRDAFLID